jgi:hypothetical protein
LASVVYPQPQAAVISQPGSSRNFWEDDAMPRDKKEKPKKTRRAKKVHKATKEQRRQKISKSGQPKGEENKPTVFQFFRTDRFSS